MGSWGLVQYRISIRNSSQTQISFADNSCLSWTISITAVLCAKLQTHWTIETYVMDKRDFIRFEFKMSFGRISYIAEHPSHSYVKFVLMLVIKCPPLRCISTVLHSPQPVVWYVLRRRKNNQFGKLVFAHVDLKEDVFALGKCILLPEPVQEHFETNSHQFMLVENMGFMHSTLDTTQVSTPLCITQFYMKYSGTPL